MKFPIYNQEGKQGGEITLPKDIFEVPMNSNLLHQVIQMQMSNRRQGSAKVKDRGEVRGGGKKPWRQKGTGRARHGSIRSPLWIGGGVTFGPNQEKNFKKKINRKIKRKAVFMVLSSKLQDKQIIFLDKLTMDNIKTKDAADILKKIKASTPVLLVIPEKNDVIIKSLNNIKNVETIEAKNINALDLASSKNLIILEKSVGIMKDTFLTKDK